MCVILLAFSSQMVTLRIGGLFSSLDVVQKGVFIQLIKFKLDRLKHALVASELAPTEETPTRIDQSKECRGFFCL